MNLEQIIKKITIDDLGFDALEWGVSNVERRFLELEISDIIIDSRLAQENAVFFALPSKSSGVDGSKYIIDAVLKGAKIVICGLNDPSPLPLWSQGKGKVSEQEFALIKTKDPYKLLIKFLKAFYFELPRNIYAITGTNGKTSIAEFIRQILNLLGKKSASIGTLGIISDNDLGLDLNYSSLTTPDIAALYKNLHILKSKNIDDVALEASSIGLEQERMAGIEIKLGGFSNFTQDHLDYHQNMADYFAAKMLLFNKQMKEGAIAVLNADIAEYQAIKKICEAQKQRIISYGFNGDDFKIISSAIKDQQSEINFTYKGQSYQIKWQILAEFQISNILCALAMVAANYNLNHQELSALLERFSNLKPALGRMQKIASLKNNAQIFIDFAHSPDALENTLKFARKLTTARVLVLFGCGGNRDAKKRSIMGKIATNLADLAIISDDNPRNEDPKKIREQILSGCNQEKTIAIAGRKSAIKSAIQMLEANDILILAGKGHEKYQIIGNQKLPFDEEQIILECI
jgi:UDP-N-acetylmuramoyl-L-alanyl-D-glutamate--2,6-diaminopimelate ligase